MAGAAQPAAVRSDEGRQLMKALTLPKVGEVRVESVPEPTLVNPHDAIIKISSSAICGSDLHAYRGRIPHITPGVPIGHEYVGVVTEVGSEVRRFKVGDRVTGSFYTACGHCWACQRGFFPQCTDSAMFGFGPDLGDLAGTQAEYARIPDADYTLLGIPDGVADEAAIFVGDVLSTAYFAAERSGIKAGETAAVVGLGPVGLLAVEICFLMGAAQVAAVDVVPERLKSAQDRGAVPVVADASALRVIREMTGGRGADAVVEAVGSETGLALALQLARGFGTISSAGVYTERAVPVSMARLFAKDLTLRAGKANVPGVAPIVMELLKHGRLHPERLFTERLPLSEGPRGYQMFADRQALKILLVP